MKRSLSIIFFIILLVAAWLSSCTADQAPSLPDFSTAYSITIIDNWGGLATAAPINSLYILENPTEPFEFEQFQGSALFSVGGYFADTKKETVQISVSKDLIRSFLEKLSQATPENGEYQPFEEHTDDYPEITIRVLYGYAETIEFYTTSQGDEHIPWKVTFNSQSYMVNTGLPMQALEILKPYLAQDVLENLIMQVEYSP